MRGYTGVCVGHGTWEMEHSAHSEFGYDLLNSLLQGKTRIESYIDRDLNVSLSDYHKGQFTTSSRDSQIWRTRRPPNVFVFSNCWAVKIKVLVDGHSEKEHDMKGITYTLPEGHWKSQKGAWCSLHQNWLWAQAKKLGDSLSAWPPCDLRQRRKRTQEEWALRVWRPGELGEFPPVPGEDEVVERELEESNQDSAGTGNRGRSRSQLRGDRFQVPSFCRASKAKTRHRQQLHRLQDRQCLRNHKWMQLHAKQSSWQRSRHCWGVWGRHQSERHMWIS